MKKGETLHLSTETEGNSDFSIHQPSDQKLQNPEHFAKKTKIKRIIFKFKVYAVFVFVSCMQQ